jgi:hypothetical protein
LTLVFGPLVCLVFAASATASNFGAYGGVFFANGNNHYFYYYNASDFTIEQTRWVRANDFDPTDLTTAYSSQAASDVTIGDSVYGPNFGFYQCTERSQVYADRCNHARVHVYTIYSSSATTRRSTLCQEIGHSVGLQHDDRNVCMNGATNSPYLTSHDRAHINGRY